MTFKVTVSGTAGPVQGLLVMGNDMLNGQTFIRSTDGNGYADLAFLGTSHIGDPVTITVFDPAFGFKGSVQYDVISPEDKTLSINVVPFEGAATRRTGLVRPIGRSVMDDSGLFHPLGMTFMWGLWGQKFERDRVRQHLKFLAPYHYDYLRILGDVDWAGEEIDPTWPDYEDVLASFIDDAWNIAGLRTEFCVTGGGRFNHTTTAIKAANVIRSRQERVIAIEGANEGWDVGVSTQTILNIIRYMRGQLPSTLMGLTSPGGSDSARIPQYMRDVGANMYTIHIDRNGGDNGWRVVRQGWDFKDLPPIVNSDEPPGPQASLYSETHPLLLAMARATGVLAGGAMYTLHVGDMVQGRADPARNRRANLWEVDNIDAILRGVRGVDSMLPFDIEDWQKFNNNWTGAPLTTNQFWFQGGGVGVNRNYAAANAGEFVEVLNGVMNRVDQVAHYNMHVDAYNPLTGEVVTKADLSVGEVWTLPGSPDTMTGYIVKGRMR